MKSARQLYSALNQIYLTFSYSILLRRSSISPQKPLNKPSSTSQPSSNDAFVMFLHSRFSHRGNISGCNKKKSTRTFESCCCCKQCKNHRNILSFRTKRREWFDSLTSFEFLSPISKFIILLTWLDHPSKLCLDFPLDKALRDRSHSSTSLLTREFGFAGNIFIQKCRSGINSLRHRFLYQIKTNAVADLREENLLFPLKTKRCEYSWDLIQVYDMNHRKFPIVLSPTKEREEKFLCEKFWWHERS